MEDTNKQPNPPGVNTSALPPLPPLSLSNLAESRIEVDRFVETIERAIREGGGSLDTHEGLIFENIVRELRAILEGGKVEAGALASYRDFLIRAAALLTSSKGGHPRPPRPEGKAPPKVSPPPQIDQKKASSPPPPPPIHPLSEAPFPEKPEKEPLIIGVVREKKESPPPTPPPPPPPPSVPLKSSIRSEVEDAEASLVSSKAIEEEFEKHMDYIFGSALLGKGKLPNGIAEADASEILAGSLDARAAEIRGIDLDKLDLLMPYLEEASKKTGLLPARAEKVEIFIRRMIAKDLSRSKTPA